MDFDFELHKLSTGHQLMDNQLTDLWSSVSASNIRDTDLKNIRKFYATYVSLNDKISDIEYLINTVESFPKSSEQKASLKSTITLKNKLVGTLAEAKENLSSLAKQNAPDELVMYGKELRRYITSKLEQVKDFSSTSNTITVIPIDDDLVFYNQLTLNDLVGNDGAVYTRTIIISKSTDGGSDQYHINMISGTQTTELVSMKLMFSNVVEMLEHLERLMGDVDVLFSKDKQVLPETETVISSKLSEISPKVVSVSVVDEVIVVKLDKSTQHSDINRVIVKVGKYVHSLLSVSVIHKVGLHHKVRVTDSGTEVHFILTKLAGTKSSITPQQFKELHSVLGISTQDVEKLRHAIARLGITPTDM